MLKFIFPGLNRSFFNPDKKMSKLCKIAFFLLFCIIIPILSFYLTSTLEEHTLYHFLSVFLFLSSAWFLDCFSTSVLVKIADKYAFDRDATFLQCVRVIMPLNMIQIYLRIFTTFILSKWFVMFLIPWNSWVNLWFLVNLFFSLKHSFDYSTKKALTVTIVQFIFTIISTFLGTLPY